MDRRRRITYGLVLILLAGIATYLLFQWIADKQTGTAPSRSDIPDRQGQAEVFLYFGSAADAFLTAEKRLISGAGDPITLSRNIIAALINGPTEQDLVRTLPQGTVCRAFYLTDDGVAYADFSAHIRDRHPGGSEAELLAIYSVVNSLVLNIDKIKKVKILVEGNETGTLAGHIDLSRPFVANMRMIR